MPSERLPIGEVTRLTGVNPATLRAWERRYGLIVPQRTGKGHRLYSQEHVERIRQILRWLNHGVAVGQVKALLGSPTDEPVQRVGNDWASLQQQLIDAIATLAERRLDQQLNQVMALYPAATLCEHLLMPLFEQLELRWQGQFSARLEQVFFGSWLRSKLGARIHHNNHSLAGPPLLVVNGSTLEFDPQLWLCAWLGSDAGCPVAMLEWSVPANELAVAVARLRPRALLVCLGKAVNLQQLERSLTGIELPTCLSGSAVSIHKAAIEAWMHTELQLSTTPLAALADLRRLQVTRDTALDREAPCN
ncbi:MerR family transcriptional regulator [Pseudomonas sp. BJa5]|uniref:MerR family transcriptional regulator n=1 Tax=Pseudomonas sp. BJa5 TaxID=2936270 RepID=UPI00255A1CEF|nr:MerR family transcriptional regulator [Pseudomonas sp. BGr12]MDL2420830.1 MerR family transcriptional regulator [Pseudomonas sp. BGr12]